MSDDQRPCGLCGEPDAGNRSCGLDLCDSCYVGDLRERLAARGFVIEQETWVEQPKSDDGVAVHHKRVTGTVRTPIRASATFSRETFGARLSRWFGKGDIEVGDPLFDDTIWVETDTDEHTRAMLRELGLQDVILEAVNDFGDVRFSATPAGCRVVVHGTWNKRRVTPEAESHQRVVACALHDLQRVTQ